MDMKVDIDSTARDRENIYSSMSLQKYGFGLKTTVSVSCLSWCGIVGGILHALGLLANLRNYQTKSDPFYGFLSISILGLIFCFFWLYIHIHLRRRNLENNVKEIMRLLKIRCYIIGGLEVISYIAGLITLAYYGYNDDEISIWVIIFLGVCLIVSLIFSIFKIYGVRKQQESYINAYTLFRLAIILLTRSSLSFHFSFS